MTPGVAMGGYRDELETVRPNMKTAVDEMRDQIRTFARHVLPAFPDKP